MDFTEQVLLLTAVLSPVISGLVLLGVTVGPQNELLLRRGAIQAKIDAWHLERRGQEHDKSAYKSFLMEIGYLVPEGEAFQIETAGVDPEIASIAGAQLVVPVSNARFALNMTNARWKAFMTPFVVRMSSTRLRARSRSGRL